MENRIFQSEEEVDNYLDSTSHLITDPQMRLNLRQELISKIPTKEERNPYTVRRELPPPSTMEDVVHQDEEAAQQCVGTLQDDAMLEANVSGFPKSVKYIVWASIALLLFGCALNSIGRGLQAIMGAFG